jgi:putative ABC transport system ATP-binding protein
LEEERAMGFVDVVQLYKAYAQGSLATPVLREVSMSFARGSFSAIVGPSGCGKTTLLSVLGALDRGDAGRVVVDGLDLLQASARELTEYRRRSVGFVFQFYNLLPSLTAVENVEAGLEFLPLGAARRRDRAIDYLARVGMADHASRFPAQLSGGQQQRVAVARALAREPKLLLADEPTGNLDEESGERIFSCIRALQRESAVTCIMVTHDTELATRVDGVVRLRDGRVVGSEPALAAAPAVPSPPASNVELRSGLRAVGSWR